jgi:hypothetical protein
MTTVSIARITREQANKSGHTKRAFVVFDPHELLPPSSPWDDTRLVIEPPVPEVTTTTEAVASYNDRLADAKIAALTNTIARQDEIINRQVDLNTKLARENNALGDRLTKAEKLARDLSTQVQRGRVTVRQIRQRLDKLDPPVAAPPISGGRLGGNSSGRFSQYDPDPEF